MAEHTTRAKKPGKTVLARRERVGRIIPLLQSMYPDAKCSLDFTNPLELIVATILSAQCTDERVNIVTRELFRKYRTAADYAAAAPEALEHDIRSTNFFRTKAKAIRSMAQSLLDRHDGEVPRTMEALIELSGVGRKTANVVLGNAFNDSVGVTVDTHVTRVSNRLGLTKHPSDAVKIELDLIEIVPREHWCTWSHWLIYHGRSICNARRPLCEQCRLLPECPTGPTVLAERTKEHAK